MTLFDALLAVVPLPSFVVVLVLVWVLLNWRETDGQFFTLIVLGGAWLLFFGLFLLGVLLERGLAGVGLLCFFLVPSLVAGRLVATTIAEEREFARREAAAELRVPTGLEADPVAAAIKRVDQEGRQRVAETKRDMGELVELYTRLATDRTRLAVLQHKYRVEDENGDAQHPE